MSLWAEFVGGTYKALSPTFAADTAINVYLETREVPGSAKTQTLYGTPGLKTTITVATNGCRGWFTQDGRTFTVVGATLYEVNPVAQTATSLGTITNDGNPVSFTSNGKGGDQIGIVGGGELKVFNTSTNTLSAAVTLPFSNPVMIVFQDGYGLINQLNTPTVWFSNLEDLTTWDALDFFTRSGTSDNIVGLAVTRDRIWTIGTATTTQFYNSGDADTPFLPYPGTTIQEGGTSPWAIAVYDNVVYWLAVSPSFGGAARFVRATDPQAQHISTAPIDFFFSRCTTLSDAEVLAYEQAGHQFVAVTCPSSPDDVQTYVFDAREVTWHARAGWNSTTGRYTRWRARGCTATATQIWVGDVSNGNLYTLDLQTYADDGGILKRERTTPYLGAESQWMFLDQFELGMQPGVGLTSGQGSDPLVMLEVSRDGARTWVTAGTARLGAIGEYVTRAIWRRLGRVRMDRLVLRVTQTDPVACVWGPGAWLRVTPGTGQL